MKTRSLSAGGRTRGTARGRRVGRLKTRTRPNHRRAERASAHTASERVRQVLRGLPYEAVEQLRATTGLPLDAVAQLIGVPVRTLHRRRREGRLKPDESDRVLRFRGIIEKAIALFGGDRTAALQWLQRPKLALGNASPLTFAQTEVGAREVEDLIGRIEHGVYT